MMFLRQQQLKKEYEEKDALIYESMKKILRGKEHIGIFLSFKSEINTFPIVKWLFEKGKKVSSSKIENQTLNFYCLRDENDTHLGTYQIPMPNSEVITLPNEMDAMIVPLLAFDKTKNRVGYGKGYYDRYLQQYQGLKIGIAYAFQYIEEVVMDEHDIAMDIIITEEQIYY